MTKPFHRLLSTGAAGELGRVLRPRLLPPSGRPLDPDYPVHRFQLGPSVLSGPIED